MSLTVIAYFSVGGVPTSGLSPTIKIRDVDTGTLVISSAAMTEVGDGYYKYDFTGFDPSKLYTILCDGGPSLVNSDRYATPIIDQTNALSDIYDDTNELQTDWADGGRLDTILDAVKSDTDELKSDLTDGGRLDNLIDAILEDTNEIQSELVDGGRTDLILDSILADTNELQTDWTDGGRLDNILDDIKNNQAQAGMNIATVTINDQNSSPVVDCRVEVWNSARTAFISWKLSDSNGQAEFALDDGTYSVVLRKVGYSFTVPETLIVSGDTSTTFTGSTVEIGSPTITDACRIYEYCYNAAGSTPLTSVTATASIVSLPYDYQGKMHTGSSTSGTYDSITGLVYWDLVKGATVRIKIDELGVNRLVTIPTTSTKRLSDLI